MHPVSCSGIKTRIRNMGWKLLVRDVCSLDLDRQQCQSPVATGN